MVLRWFCLYIIIYIRMEYSKVISYIFPITTDSSCIIILALNWYASSSIMKVVSSAKPSWLNHKVSYNLKWYNILPNNSLPWTLMSTKRYDYSSCLFFCSIKIVIKVHSCMRSFADVFVFINYKCEVSSNCVLVYQWKIAFLNNSSRRNSITSKFKHKKASLTIKMIKTKLFNVFNVGSNIWVIILLFKFCN